MHLKQKHSWQSTCLQLPIFQPRLSKTTSPLLRGILTWKKISTYRKTISLILTSLTDKMFSFEDFFWGGASGTPALVVSRIMPVVPYRHHWLQFAHYHTNLPIEGDFFLFSDNVSAIRYLLFSHVTAAIIVFQKNETAAMLVSQSNLVGVEVFPCVITFFWSTKFA